MNLRPRRRLSLHTPTHTAARLRYMMEQDPAPIRSVAPKLASDIGLEHETKQMGFTLALIALCAHVACAQGPLSRRKYIAFRAAFPLTGGICGKLRKLFMLACESGVPFETYVTQIKFAYPKQKPLFMAIIERLFAIALADGTVAPAAERVVSKAAHMLGLSAPEYVLLRDRAMNPAPQDVLGVGKRQPLAALKKRYHSLMRHYHPDRWQHEALSPELAEILSLRASQINEAYRVMRKRR